MSTPNQSPRGFSARSSKPRKKSSVVEIEMRPSAGGWVPFRRKGVPRRGRLNVQALLDRAPAMARGASKTKPKPKQKKAIAVRLEGKCPTCNRVMKLQAVRIGPVQILACEMCIQFGKSGLAIVKQFLSR